MGYEVNEIAEEIFQEALKLTGNGWLAGQLTMDTLEKILLSSPQNNEADFSSLICDEPRDNMADGTLREVKKTL